MKSDQERAVEYVVAHTREDEAIFVGNSRHDRIFTNDVGFYFLSGRPSATRFHELFPGVATTLLVQKEIARDIESMGVRCVVLVHARQSEEPNSSAVSSGVYYLDEFIRSRYTPVARFGKYEIRKRFGG